MTKSHADCNHPSTKSARARCRKGLVILGLTTTDLNHGTTPRDKWQQCDNCGVEKVFMRGTDPLTGILRYVGPRCEYIIRHATDAEGLA